MALVGSSVAPGAKEPQIRMPLVTEPRVGYVMQNHPEVGLAIFTDAPSLGPEGLSECDPVGGCEVVYVPRCHWGMEAGHLLLYLRTADI